MFDMSLFPLDEQMQFPLGAYPAEAVKALCNNATVLMAEHVHHEPRLLTLLQDYCQCEQANAPMRAGLAWWEIRNESPTTEEALRRGERGLAIGIEALTLPVMDCFLRRDSYIAIDVIAAYIDKASDHELNKANLPVSLLVSLTTEFVRVQSTPKERKKYLKELVDDLPVPEGMKKALHQAAEYYLPGMIWRPTFH